MSREGKEVEVKLARVPRDPSYASLEDASSRDVLHLMLGAPQEGAVDEDVEVFGRMPVGLDESEFDLMPPLEANVDPADDGTYDSIFSEPADDESVEGEHDNASARRRRERRVRYHLHGDDGEDVPAFKPNVADAFPRYTEALRRYKSSEPMSRALRVDTDETHGQFVAESAVRELGRRLNELRAAVEQHESDGHGPPAAHLSQWDEVIGAAKLVEDLSAAQTASDAADALPQVDVDLPDFARDKVKCWRDGDAVVVSLRFGAMDGTPRIATMAAKPRADADEVAAAAARSGVDPAVVLGALPALVDRACAKRLVKDVAGAALKVQRRVDLLGMDEPLILVGAGGRTAPVAALMDLQQQADAGDAQARREVSALDAACSTVAGAGGRHVMAEARRRLASARAASAPRTYAQRYAEMGMYL